MDMSETCGEGGFPRSTELGRVLSPICGSKSTDSKVDRRWGGTPAPAKRQELLHSRFLYQTAFFQRRFSQDQNVRSLLCFHSRRIAPCRACACSRLPRCSRNMVRTFAKLFLAATWVSVVRCLCMPGVRVLRKLNTHQIAGTLARSHLHTSMAPCVWSLL
jgi:hypothetical protein